MHSQTIAAIPTSLSVSAILPAVTHGDESSVTFFVTQGPSINMLRTQKAQMDRGELASCEGIFHLKPVIGKAHRRLGRSPCELQLRIDIIDDTAAGLIISGEILRIAQGNLLRSLEAAKCDARVTGGIDCSEQFGLLHAGTRLKLLHRGAASAGALVYIQDLSAMRIHFPHVPPDTKRPLQTIERGDKEYRPPIRSHTGYGRVSPSIPYRF